MVTEPRVCLDRGTGNETNSEASEVAENIVVTPKITRKSPVWAYFHLAETIKLEANEDQSDVCEYSAKRSDTAIFLLCKCGCSERRKHIKFIRPFESPPSYKAHRGSNCHETCQMWISGKANKWL